MYHARTTTAHALPCILGVGIKKSENIHSCLVFFLIWTWEKKGAETVFYCTFDNRDTIPVCHHYGMKTLNAKGGQLVGINLVV